VLREFGVSNPAVCPLQRRRSGQAANELGGPVWVVKAQIPRRRRGKGRRRQGRQIDRRGEKESARILGSFLVTHQTGPKGSRSIAFTSTTASAIEKEFYLSMLVRSRKVRASPSWSRPKAA